MTTTDMNPRMATLMELIRELLNLRRIVDCERTTDAHRRVIITALP